MTPGDMGTRFSNDESSKTQTDEDCARESAQPVTLLPNANVTVATHRHQAMQSPYLLPKVIQWVGLSEMHPVYEPHRAHRHLYLRM